MPSGEIPDPRIDVFCGTEEYCIVNESISYFANDTCLFKFALFNCGVQLHRDRAFLNQLKILCVCVYQ